MAKRKVNYMDTARRYGRSHLPASAWSDKDIKALADLLRTIAVRSYGDGFNAGYASGHEEQMKMRIADANERAATSPL